MAFGLVNGFIEDLKTVTTSKCLVITNLHFNSVQRLHHVCATLYNSLLCTVDLYTHSSTCTHGVVLNYLSTGTTYKYICITIILYRLRDDKIN
jgi:hypothetical protein